MIEEQYITFETAKLAKEKEFDEEFENMHVWNNFKGEILEDVSGYNMKNSHLCKNSYSAPTQSLLARWLREKHKMIVSCVFNYETKMWVYFIGNYNNPISKSDKEYDSYEEAMEDGLQDALELVKSW